MGTLASLRALAPGERRVLGRAWAMLALVTLALRVVSLRRLLRTSRTAASAAGTTAPARVVSLVAVAARRVPGAGCLPQAIVAARLLARDGTPVMLRVGVAREAGSVGAHARL